MERLECWVQTWTSLQAFVVNAMNAKHLLQQGLEAVKGKKAAACASQSFWSTPVCSKCSLIRPDKCL